ncbi:MAG: protein kinase [Vicinamibacterales bacterium]
MPDGSQGRFVGRTLSHYRVIAPLGAGGMGVVYRGEDVRLGRPVAIKFVAEDFADDAQAIARLNAEAKAASALNHPNICTIYDVGTDDGHPFIVMELMEGQTLRERLTRGHLKVHELVDVGIQAADALQGAHSANIVHRDIKPANIFITGRGHVKILDFGLAKLAAGARGTNNETRDTPDLTAAGTTIGTVSYMSPEQATDEDLDGRTDLFSLGVVLYECATGRQPFEGKVPAVILAAILNRAPVLPSVLNPELPTRLQDVIMTCLEKDRELRYQSAADLRADLKRIRRDLESGRTRVGQTSDTLSLTDSDRHLVPTASTRTATPSGSAASAAATAGAAASGSGPAAPAPGSRTTVIVGAGVLVLAALAGVLFLRQRATPAPSAAPQAQAAPAPSGPDRMALAESSLAARNFRAALAYAGDVLAASPGNADARRVRDEATAALARVDGALTLARQRLQQNDLTGASRALATARDIDPTDVTVVEFAAELGERLRTADATPAPGTPTRPVGATPQAPVAPAARGTDRPVAPAPAPTAPPNAQAPPIAQTPPPLPVPAASTPAPPPAPEPEPARVARPATPAPEDARPSAPAPPSRSDEEAAIRRVVASYGRAIETKDIALFRTVKPNLTRDEERRLQEGFRAVASQQVRLTVQSLDLRDQAATVVAQRHDQIEAGGRRQSVDSRQTFTLARTAAGWTITDIR